MSHPRTDTKLARPGASFWQVLEARQCGPRDAPGGITALIAVIAIVALFYLIYV